MVAGLGIWQEIMDHFSPSLFFKPSMNFDFIFPVSEESITGVYGVGDAKFRVSGRKVKQKVIQG